MKLCSSVCLFIYLWNCVRQSVFLYIYETVFISLFLFIFVKLCSSVCLFYVYETVFMSLSFYIFMKLCSSVCLFKYLWNCFHQSVSLYIYEIVFISLSFYIFMKLCSSVCLFIFFFLELVHYFLQKKRNQKNILGENSGFSFFSVFIFFVINFCSDLSKMKVLILIL